MARGPIYRPIRKAPGLKVCSTRAKPVRTELYDASGKWLATVRWRPRGESYFELSPDVKKTVCVDNTAQDGEDSQ
jgi:hypothetical protein